MRRRIKMIWALVGLTIFGMLVWIWAQEELPHCPDLILVQRPKRPCPTPRPCYAKGTSVPGVCCVDFYLPSGQWGCCQFISRIEVEGGLRLCVCRDDTGVEHTCVDDLGYPEWTGNRGRQWDLADPQFFCCWHGRNKGQCVQDDYDCSS
jgi:hypothetical protein